MADVQLKTSFYGCKCKRETAALTITSHRVTPTTAVQAIAVNHRYGVESY